MRVLFWISFLNISAENNEGQCIRIFPSDIIQRNLQEILHFLSSIQFFLSYESASWNLTKWFYWWIFKYLRIFWLTLGMCCWSKQHRGGACPPTHFNKINVKTCWTYLACYQGLLCHQYGPCCYATGTARWHRRASLGTASYASGILAGFSTVFLKKKIM